MKIGVTGGGGFIGSWVIDELLIRNLEVVVLDRTNPGIVNKNYSPKGVEYFMADVRDPISVHEFAAHVDGIIHLAAVLGTQETIQNPFPSVETNIIGSLNVFEAAVAYDIPVVYAGVGNHWMRSQAGGSYTITKTAVEDFAKTYNQFRGSRISVVRPVNAYGPRQSVAAPFGPSKVRKIIPSFVCRALIGEDIEVYGDGTQISDCVHVADVAYTFVTAIEDLLDGSEPQTDLEVGPVVSVTVNDIAELVKRFAESDSEIKHLPMRPGEVPNAVVSANYESLQGLGIDANYFIDLETGIRQTVNWYRENWLPKYLGVSR